MSTLIALLLGAAAAPVLAQDVFRSVDENGVVTFSDVASEDAERLRLASVPVRESSLAAQQEMIEQQLAVAKALETSRLAREDARTRRLEALAAAGPRTVYYPVAERTRYVGGYLGWNNRWWGSGRPGHPGKPGHPGVRPPHPVHPIAPPGGGGHPVNPPSRRVGF